MLNAFYRLMGADVSWGANVASLFREFDLVRMDYDSDIAGNVVPRLLTTQGVAMHRIQIGVAAKVDSMATVLPGVVVEDGATVKKRETPSCWSKVQVESH